MHLICTIRLPKHMNYLSQINFLGYVKANIISVCKTKINVSVYVKANKSFSIYISKSKKNRIRLLCDCYKKLLFLVLYCLFLPITF